MLLLHDTFPYGLIRAGFELNLTLRKHNSRIMYMMYEPATALGKGEPKPSRDRPNVRLLYERRPGGRRKPTPGQGLPEGRAASAERTP